MSSIHPTSQPFSRYDYDLLFQATKGPSTDKHPLTKEVAQAAKKLFNALENTALNKSNCELPSLQNLAFKVRSLALTGTRWSVVDSLCSAIVNLFKDLWEGREVKLASSASRLLESLDQKHLEGLLLDLETEANLEIATFLSTPFVDPATETKELEQIIEQIHYVLAQVKQVNLNVSIEPLMTLCSKVEDTVEKKQQGGTHGMGMRELAQTLAFLEQGQQSGISNTVHQLTWSLQRLHSERKLNPGEKEAEIKNQQSKLLIGFALQEVNRGNPLQKEEIEGLVNSIKHPYYRH